MLTESQIEERRTGLGSSDAAIVCGLSTYMTRVELYLEKKGFLNKSFEMNEQQYWGHVQEPIIAMEYEKRSGKKLFEVSTIRSKDYSFMLAHLDRMVEGENAALEIKNVGAYNAHKWGEEGSDEIPDDYLVQVAHQAIVANLDRVYVAAYIGGNEFRTYTYERNKRLEANLIDQEQDFWVNHIEKDIAPEASNYDDVRLLYPSENGEAVYIDEDDSILDEIKKYKEISEKSSSAEKEKENQKAVITKFMGAHSMLRIRDSNALLATFKDITRKKFEEKKLAIDKPLLHAKYMSSINYRQLNIKEVKL